MTIYRVSHEHESPEWAEVEETFHIGTYSTREKAEAAIAELRAQPGFADTPDGFVISEDPLDETFWEEGYITVGPDFMPGGKAARDAEKKNA